eukprot:8679052-Ditylum_brightwellii.AAC.1
MNKSTKSKAKSKGSRGDKGGGSNNKRSREGKVAKKRLSSKAPVPSKRRKGCQSSPPSSLLGAKLLARMGKDTSQCTTRSS